MPAIYWQNIISLGLLVIQKKLFKDFHIFDPCDLESRSMSFIWGNFLALHPRYPLAKYHVLILVTLKVGQGHLFEETL